MRHLTYFSAALVLALVMMVVSPNLANPATEERKKIPVEAQLEGAAVELRDGKYGAVSKFSERFLKEHPESFEARFLWGSALLRSGSIEAACVQLREASWIDPLQWGDEIETNRALLEEALRQIPSEPQKSKKKTLESVRTRAQILLVLDRPAEAMPLCEKWQELDAKAPGATDCLTDLHTRNGAIDRAFNAVLRGEKSQGKGTLVYLVNRVQNRGANFCRLAERTFSHYVERGTVPPLQRSSEFFFDYLAGKKTTGEMSRGSPRSTGLWVLALNLATCFQVLELAAESSGREVDRFEDLDMSIPVPVLNFTPTYPELARVARVDGYVISEGVVRTDGTVQDMRALELNRPNLGFEEAALEALKRSRFIPAKLNGKPVAIRLRSYVEFKLLSGGP